MSHIPTDPFILLSYINTQLRNHYPTLDELCTALSLDKTAVTDKLDSIGYSYQPGTNQFQ